MNFAKDYRHPLKETLSASQVVSTLERLIFNNEKLHVYVYNLI